MNTEIQTVGETTINNLQGQIMEARKEKAINAIKNSFSSLTLYFDKNLEMKVCVAVDDGDMGTMFKFLEHMSDMVKSAMQDMSNYIPQI